MKEAQIIRPVMLKKVMLKRDIQPKRLYRVFTGEIFMIICVACTPGMGVAVGFEVEVE